MRSNIALVAVVGLGKMATANANGSWLVGSLDEPSNFALVVALTSRVSELVNAFEHRACCCCGSCENRNSKSASEWVGWFIGR